MDKSGELPNQRLNGLRWVALPMAVGLIWARTGQAAEISANAVEYLQAQRSAVSQAGRGPRLVQSAWQKRQETGRIAVEREPVAAALTRDGQYLLVANHLPVGRADVGQVSAHVSVVDVSAAKVIRQIVLPNGANLLRSLAISPDGRFACVTHTLARFHLPTTQVERGWMNANAFSLIDISNWTNQGDQHGRTSHLSQAQLQDLVEYLLSL